MSELATVAAPQPLRLDLGCGKAKREGFFGVDAIMMPGVDKVHDLAHHTWPWDDNTVDEVHCSHMVEHLEPRERVFFWNEMYRVMRVGAKATIVAPSWSSCRAYGDPTHKWPPICEMTWHYLNKAWRKDQAPHADAEIAPGPLGLACDFDFVPGNTVATWMIGRDKGFIDFALTAYKESSPDLICTLTKRGP